MSVRTQSVIIFNDRYCNLKYCVYTFSLLTITDSLDSTDRTHSSIKVLEILITVDTVFWAGDLLATSAIIQIYVRTVL